jgi:hypothetical protein
MLTLIKIVRAAGAAAGCCALAAGAFGLTVAVAAAEPRPPAVGHAPCFLTNQWQGWRSPSSTVIYFRVNRRDVYRIDLVSGSPNLQRRDLRLISEERGSDMICSALDLQLTLSDGHGFREPLIARSLVKLTDLEAQALPAKERP